MRKLTLMLCLPLGGCFFFWIPTSAFQRGNMCVSESTYVGQRIRNRDNGRIGTVKELLGRSSRCQSGAEPILADVELES